MRIGCLPFGRPTFDVDFAKETLNAMLSALDRSGHEIVGPRELLFDAEQAETAFGALDDANVDAVLVLQVTFTDAALTVAAANRFSQPLNIWAIPEPRAGGRLRLNSFCGLNLASHALGLNGRGFGWLYADPEDIGDALAELLSGARPSGKLEATSAGPATDEAETIVGRISGRRVGRIGAHPAGFDTCAYDATKLRALAGVEVDAIELDTLFDSARQADANAVEKLRSSIDADALDKVDSTELDRSLRLKLALDQLRGSGGYDAFAIRCWPETFTEYGGAVCGPVSMMGEARVPCACEADVYGALTQMILQETSGEPVFLTDLVDMDADDDTGVVWHCGQAPLSMLPKGQRAMATIHTNRKMPLLFEFALKPGRVTFCRVSQSFGEQKMVIAGGQMLERPMSFTGTSGVVRFDRPAATVLDDIIASGLEHHMALAYGDHRNALRAVAAALELPVLEL